MSFVDGFFSFSVQLSHVARQVYDTIRVKVVKHPDESLEYLVARVLAYYHAYSADLVFTQGLYTPKEPTLRAQNAIAACTQWIEVGEVDSKKLRHAVRKNSDTEFSVYFFDDAQVQQFCSSLRGAKENWVEQVGFLQFHSEIIGLLVEELRIRNDWILTFSDDTFFLETENLTKESTVRNLYIWDEYQQYIGNSP